MKYDKKSVKVFFGVVIVLSIILETVIIASGAMGLAAFLMWVPALGAFLAKMISHRKEKGYLGFRMCSIKYIVLAIFLPLLYIGIPYVCYWFYNPQSLVIEDVKSLLIFLIIGIPISMLTAIGEEIGWRGFMLPAFFERMSLQKALFFSSLIWCVWHLPVLMSGLYMPGTPLWYAIPMFMLCILPVGIMIGILTYQSKSVWPAVVFHASHNHFDQTIFGDMTVGSQHMYFVSETGILTVIMAWTIAIILLLRIKKAQ